MHGARESASFLGGIVIIIMHAPSPASFLLESHDRQVLMKAGINSFPAGGGDLVTSELMNYEIASGSNENIVRVTLVIIVTHRVSRHVCM